MHYIVYRFVSGFLQNSVISLSLSTAGYLIKKAVTWLVGSSAKLWPVFLSAFDIDKLTSTLNVLLWPTPRFFELIRVVYLHAKLAVANNCRVPFLLPKVGLLAVRFRLQWDWSRPLSVWI